MAGTTTIPCNCDHEFQDKQYGRKVRLANISENGLTKKCTVCGNKHSKTTRK